MTQQKKRMDLNEFEENELNNINFNAIEKKMFKGEPTRSLKRSVKAWLVYFRKFEKFLSFAGFKISISITKIKNK